MNSFPWLTFITIFPTAAGLLIPFISDNTGKKVRWYTLGISLINLLVISYIFANFYEFESTSLQLVENSIWINNLFLHWHLAIDGLSIPLVLLTGFITTISVLSAWPVTKNAKLFHFLILLMFSAQLGVFLAQDFLLFFFMWELELIPVYLLISIWGGAQRQYAATKFILYTAIASVFILIGGLSLAIYTSDFSFQFDDISKKEIPLNLQILLYFGFLISYGVKLPAFPAHTWLPDAHGEAYTSASMLLAGVLLKMGGYALVRINMMLLPEAHKIFSPVLIVIGVINIIYAACTAFAQRNLKRKIAYSSISHMGFVLIGIGSLSVSGLNGAIFQMISHGLIGAALFFLAGIIYDRTQTLNLESLGGLGESMPKVFLMMTTCCLASLALPGLSGFLAEFLVFLGLITSEQYTVWFKAFITFFEAIGVILTPIYLLSMLRQVFYGTSVISYKDAGPREVFVFSSFLVPILSLGLYPKLAIKMYEITSQSIVNLFV